MKMLMIALLCGFIISITMGTTSIDAGNKTLSLSKLHDHCTSLCDRQYPKSDSRAVVTAANMGCHAGCNRVQSYTMFSVGATVVE
jgi:hypothetical protein